MVKWSGTIFSLPNTWWPFPHLENSKSIEIISAVDEGTSSHREGGRVIPSPSHKKHSDVNPPSLLPVRQPDTNTAPCFNLALVPMPHYHNDIGASSPPSLQTPTHIASNLTHSSPSLLISFVLHDDPNQTHSSLVYSIKKALQVPSKTDLKMDDLDDSRSMLGSDDSSSHLEPNDGMLLSYYQKDIKLEALAKHAPTINKFLSKKRRSTSTM